MTGTLQHRPTEDQITVPQNLHEILESISLLIPRCPNHADRLEDPELEARHGNLSLLLRDEELLSAPSSDQMWAYLGITEAQFRDNNYITFKDALATRANVFFRGQLRPDLANFH